MSEFSDLRDNLPHGGRGRSRAKMILRADSHKDNGIDASDYYPEIAASEGVQTGARPIRSRAYKRGGKVAKHVGEVHGEHAKHHAGRKPRKADSRAHRADGGSFVPSERMNFGSAGSSRLSKAAGLKRGGVAEFEGSPRDVREDRKLAKKHHMSHHEWENSEMDERHDRQKSMKGLKRGGKVHHANCKCHKCAGGPFDVSDGKLQGTRPVGFREIGERAARKSGGRAKGKTNINIIIGSHGAPQPGGMASAPPQPPVRGVPVPPPSAPMGGMPPGMPPGMPAGAAPGMMPPGAPPPPMPRKRGGRASPLSASEALGEHDTGSGGGLGRLAKIRSYGHYD